MSRVDQEIELAAFIRQIDGNNDMGACKLAERILEWQAARQQAVPSVCPRCLGASPEKVYGASAAFPPYEICSNLEHVPVTYAANTAAAPQAEQCDTCHGQGEVWTGQMQSFGQMSMQPPEPIMEECPECGGEEPQAEQVVEPVAIVDSGDDGYFAEILPDRTVNLGQLLYTAPPAPDVSAIEKAIQQITGYTCGRLYTAEDLVSDMGLTPEEWTQIKTECSWLNPLVIEDIDDALATHGSNSHE